MIKFDFLDNANIKYIIIKKRVKRLSISYNQYGTLEINQPYRLDDEIMINFVNAHEDWIINHKPVKALPHLSYHNGDEYLFLGKKYKLNIVYSKYEKAFLSGKQIIVYAKDAEKIENVLENFRMENAELVFNEILYKSFLVMEDKLPIYPNLIIKRSKARWGCCFIKDNKIMLNISLVNVPLELIEYVIFHELCHFVYPNHGAEFHHLLSQYIPNERSRQKQLKGYSVIYK